ncbi:MAG: DUF2281 domain-containing protein [Candidatus Kryptoniota bacterium]
MSIEEMVKRLPEELQKEVIEFVQFLLEKRSKKKGSRLSQDWAGALRDYKSEYTSIQLQKKVNEWRGD